MLPPDPADLSWAGPDLRRQLESDPAAVLRDRGVNAPADLPRAVVHEFVRVVMLVWVDGKLVPADQFHIDPADEGLLFGRGAWESTRTAAGVPWLWPLHLDRLRETIGILRLGVTPDRLPDADAVAGYVRGLTSQDVVVRLNASAGRPGKPGVVWMTAFPLAVPPAAVRLKTARRPMPQGDPYQTLKTFEYASRLRFGQQPVGSGFDTALVVDPDGNVLEAAHANLFVKLPEGWATPPAGGGFLPGTVRHVLVQKSPVPIREQVIPQVRLAEVTEAFVTNSNVGAVPVTRIDGFELPVGDDTRAVMKWLEPPARAGVQYRLAGREAPPR